MGYKQQLKRKQKGYARLYKYHLEHPDISFRDLGEIFKITGARVGQILKAMREKE
jgi:hypothetical protein